MDVGDVAEAVPGVGAGARVTVTARGGLDDADVDGPGELDVEAGTVGGAMVEEVSRVVEAVGVVSGGAVASVRLALPLGCRGPAGRGLPTITMITIAVKMTTVARARVRVRLDMSCVSASDPTSSPCRTHRIV